MTFEHRGIHSAAAVWCEDFPSNPEVRYSTGFCGSMLRRNIKYKWVNVVRTPAERMPRYTQFTEVVIG